MSLIQERTLSLWGNRVHGCLKVAGEGVPVVFLHSEWGLVWDPVLESLTQDYRVYAPEHPGTNTTYPDDIRAVDTLYDLVVYYYELFDELGLQRPPVIGHSFGGMVACELAAACPDRVDKLVLINPLGLWREDVPIRNWMASPVGELVEAFFADTSAPVAQMMKAALENPLADVEQTARVLWSLGCTGKFAWPVPDRGLWKRIHRIKAPTLILWGREDKIVPATYGEEFVRRIRSARLEVIEGAGHAPQLEQPERVAQVIGRFLREEIG